MTLGLLAAVAAAACYGVGSVLQAVAARRTSPGDRLDPRLLVRLAGQLPYVAGLGLDLVGFVLEVVALHSLPLFLVQSVIASSVGVTAVVAVRVLGLRLRRPELVALATLVAGLVLLAGGAQPGHADALSKGGQWLLLGSVALVAVAAPGAARLRGQRAVVTLAALAGASFGGVGISARGLGVPHPLWQVLTLPTVWALAAFGILGTLLFATALQRGSVTVASAVMFAVETVLPSVVGFSVLGDAVRPGAGVFAAAAGFVLTLGGAIALAPYAAPSSDRALT